MTLNKFVTDIAQVITPVDAWCWLIILLCGIWKMFELPSILAKKVQEWIKK